MYDHPTHSILRNTNHKSSLGGTCVFPTEFAIDGFEVVGARPDIFDRSLGGIISGVVVLLTKLERMRQFNDKRIAFDEAYTQSIDIFLARHNFHAA